MWTDNSLVENLLVLVINLKMVIKRYKRVGYNMDSMPGYEHSHGSMVSGLRLNGGPGIKLSSVGWCLVLVLGWDHRSST